MPGPVSATAKAIADVVASARFDRRRHDDTARVGEFHRVAGKVHQDLAEARRIDPQTIRNGRIHVDGKVDALLVRSSGEERRHFGEKVVEARRLGPDVEAAGFDPGEIEEILDEPSRAVPEDCTPRA